MGSALYVHIRGREEQAWGEGCLLCGNFWSEIGHKPFRYSPCPPSSSGLTNIHTCLGVMGGLGGVSAHHISPFDVAITVNCACQHKLPGLGECPWCYIPFVPKGSSALYFWAPLNGWMVNVGTQEFEGRRWGPRMSQRRGVVQTADATTLVHWDQIPITDHSGKNLSD